MHYILRLTLQRNSGALRGSPFFKENKPRISLTVSRVKTNPKVTNVAQCYATSNKTRRRDTRKINNHRLLLLSRFSINNSARQKTPHSFGGRRARQAHPSGNIHHPTSQDGALMNPADAEVYLPSPVPSNRVNFTLQSSCRCHFKTPLCLLVTRS